MRRRIHVIWGGGYIHTCLRSHAAAAAARVSAGRAPPWRCSGANACVCVNIHRGIRVCTYIVPVCTHTYGYKSCARGWFISSTLNKCVYIHTHIVCAREDRCIYTHIHCVCALVYIHTYIVCVYICTHMRCVCARVQMYMQEHINKRRRSVCARTDVYAWEHINKRRRCTRVQMYMHTYIHTYTHINTHIIHTHIPWAAPEGGFSHPCSWEEVTTNVCPWAHWGKQNKIK